VGRGSPNRGGGDVTRGPQGCGLEKRNVGDISRQKLNWKEKRRGGSQGGKWGRGTGFAKDVTPLGKGRGRTDVEGKERNTLGRRRCSGADFGNHSQRWRSGGMK